MAIFHGIEHTQYGQKIKLDNEKGKGVKKYNATPEALTMALSMAPSKKTYPSWSKDNQGFPVITGFSDTPPPQSGGGSKWKSQPYHPETFVSNVVGQAIQAQLIKTPTQIKEWASAAWTTIKGLQEDQRKSAPVTLAHPPVAQVQSSANYNELNPPPAEFDDDIPY